MYEYTEEFADAFAAQVEELLASGAVKDGDPVATVLADHYVQNNQALACHEAFGLQEGRSPAGAIRRSAGYVMAQGTGG